VPLTAFPPEGATTVEIWEAVQNPNPGTPALLVPVKIPIRDLRVFNTDTEMVLEANVG
jgi:hypothetical protein